MASIFSVKVKAKLWLKAKVVAVWEKYVVFEIAAMGNRRKCWQGKQLAGKVEVLDLEFTVAPICETCDLFQQHSIC